MPLGQRASDRSGLLSAVAACEHALARSGHRVIGKVNESPRAFDIAFVDLNGEEAVIRCANDPIVSDHRALKTMIAEGDFDRAFLVHSDECAPPPGDIPTYSISRIHELAALLANGELP